MQQKLVLIYGRVSEADDQEKSSVPQQLKEGRAFAEAKWPGESIEIVPETGSARDIKGRPEFCRLLAMCQDGRVSRVVVRDQDRLARSDAVELLQCFAFFQRHRVEVWQYRGGQQIKTDDPHSKLTTTIFGAIAEFERSISALRVRDKMRAMRCDGKWTGGAVPLGYRLTEADGQKTFAPDEKAPAVRRVFQVAAETHSLAEAWRESVRAGLWRAKQSLEHALKNRVYLGEWHKACGGWIVDHHEALIDHDVFAQAQRTEGLNYNPRQRKIERVFTLQGLVFCPYCACLMRPYHVLKKNGLRFFYYECNGRSKRACPVKRMPASELEVWVWEELQTLCRDPKVLEVALTAHERVHNSGNALATAELDAARKRLQAATNRREGLLTYLDSLFAEGKQPALSVNDKLQAVDVEVAQLKSDVEAAKRKVHPTERIKADQFLKSLRFILADGTFTPKRQQAVFRTLIRRVVVAKDGITVELLDPTGAQLKLGDGTTGTWFEQSSGLAERVGFEPT